MDAEVYSRLVGQRFRRAAVVPAWRSVPEDKQRQYVGCCTAQVTHLGDVLALPAIMDLQADFGRLPCEHRKWDGCGSLYKASKKLHVRDQVETW